MQPEMSSQRLFHLLARYTYLQDLIDGQRVLVLGKAEAIAAEALDEHGIRRAVFIDSSEQRVIQARRKCRSPRVEFIRGPLSRVALVEDSFDVAIIEDFGKIEDRERALAASKKGLSSSGLLVACIPNPDAGRGLIRGEKPTLGYYEFYGQLADSFPFVRMVGQCPIVGFTLADLSSDEDETSISFDSSMLEEGSEDAEFFVALCSRSPIEADPFAIVQVPLDWVEMGLAPQQIQKRRIQDSVHQRPTIQAKQPEQVAKVRFEQEEELGKVKRQFERQKEDAQKEVTRLKLDLDKRAVTIAKLENHLREAREKASVEHNRVIQTKIAFENERKKVLSLEKEFEMGRRIQKMSPQAGPEPHVAEITEIEKPEQSTDELETKLRESEKEAKRLEAEVKSLTEKIADPEPLKKQIQQLETQLESEKELRKKVEERINELDGKANRADVLAADLGRERGARKLAESHASELEKQLREIKGQAESGKPKLSPMQVALKKAEAAFSAPPSSELVESLKAELESERDRRVQLENRFNSIDDGGVAALEEELKKERTAREEAESAKVELEGELSKAEAYVARVASEEEARRRVEAAFAGTTPDQSSDLGTLKVELEVERQKRIEIQTKGKEQIDRCMDAKYVLEKDLKEERELRHQLESTIEQLKSQQVTTEAEKPDEAVSAPSEQESPDREAELEKLRKLTEESERSLATVEETHGKEIAKLENALKEKGEQVRSLKEKVEQGQELLERVLGDLQKAQRDSPELQGQIDNQESELVEARRKLEIAEKESAELQTKLRLREREMADLEGEVQSLKWRISELELGDHDGPLDFSAAEEPDDEPDEAADEVIDAPMLSFSGDKKPTSEPPPRLDDDSTVDDSRLEELEQKNRQLEISVDQANTRASAMERKAFESMTQIRALERQLNQVRSEKEKIEAKISEDEKKAQESAEIPSDTRNEALEQAEKEISELTQKIAGLEGELNSSKERAAQLVGELAQAQAAASLARSELSETQEQADDASIEKAKLGAQIDQLKGQLSSSEQQLQTKSEKLSELTEKLEKLETLEAQPKKDDGHDQKAKINALERLLKNCREENAKREGTIVGLSFKVGEIDSVQERTGVPDDRFKEIQAELGRKSEELESINAKVLNLTNELRTKQETEREKSQQLDSIKEKLLDTQRRARELEYIGERTEEWASRLENAEKEGQRIRSELEAARQRIVVLESELSQSSDESESAIELQRKIDEQKNRIAELNQERQSAEEALERVLDGYTDVKGDATVLADILTERDQQIDRLEEDIAETRHSQLPAPPDGPSTEEDYRKLYNDCLRKLDSARRIVIALEKDKKRLSLRLTP